MIAHSEIQQPYRDHLTDEDVVLRTHYSWGCIVLRKGEDGEQFMWLSGARSSSREGIDSNTRGRIKLKFDYVPSNPLPFDEVTNE